MLSAITSVGISSYEKTEVRMKGIKRQKALIQSTKFTSSSNSFVFSWGSSSSPHSFSYSTASKASLSSSSVPEVVVGTTAGSYVATYSTKVLFLSLLDLAGGGGGLSTAKKQAIKTIRTYERKDRTGLRKLRTLEDFT